MTWEELMAQEWPHRGRDGVISCSKLDRLFACPAQRHLDLPKGEPGYAAISGTVLHYLILESGCDHPPEDTPDDKKELFYWIKDIMASDVGTYYANEVYHETDILTGAADHIRIDTNGMSTMFIRDIKTGRNKVEIETKQLLGYAYLMMLAHKDRGKTKSWNVGIIQPLVYGSYIPTVTYGIDDLLHFEEDLKQRLGAKYFGFPGSHCDWCPAKGTSKCESTKNILEVFNA